MTSDNGQAMKNLFAAYDDDDDANESRAAKRRRGDSDEEMSDPNAEDEVIKHLPSWEADGSINNKVSSPTDPSDNPVIRSEQESTVDKAESKDQVSFDPKPTQKTTRLVSYGPDEVDDDDDDDNDDLKSSESEDDPLFEFVTSSETVGDKATMSNTELNNSLAPIRRSLSVEEVQLPPEPAGKCSIKLQDKVAKLYAKVLRSGMDMNASIQKRKDFRNPSIYEKLVEFCGIDEKGTNYPPHLYNPSIWGKESNYENLANEQRKDLDRREKERKERQQKEKGFTVERVIGTKKTGHHHHASAGSSPEQKRRSKWDAQTGSGSLQIPAVGPISKPKANN